MRKTFLFLFLASSFFSFSQVEDAWVYFNAKPDFQTYLDNPLTMLTQRALDRRTNQSISLDFLDVPIYQPYINQIIASNGITVKAKSKWLNCVHIRGLQSDINALKLLGFVSKVDFADKTLNLTGKISKLAKIKAVNKVLSTQINYNYGSSNNQILMLNGILLHQQNYTGYGKIIAVLDAGFPGVDTAPTFQRLRDNNQILGGYNYVTKSSSFYTGDSHGTLVLSTMGGFVDGQLVGTAPDANYYLFVTEDAATENPVEESNWVEAAEEADRLGVDIISTSLGYFGYDNPAYSHTYSDMTGNATFISKGANIAFSRGMICVASAGNEGQTTEPHIGVPAEALNVLAIGAVQADKTYASFSSIGPSFDNRIKPDVMAQGQMVVFSDVTGNIGTGNGTSFSCPIMAGMVACLWQALPTKTNQEIRQLITQSADRFSNPNAQYGFGIPDFALAKSRGLSVEVFSKKDFIIYPNPTSDTVFVTFPEGSDKGIITIYSILGQKLAQKIISNQSPTISIKALNKGMYFFKVDFDDFSKSGKIIKE